MTLTNKLAQAANPKTPYQVFLEQSKENPHEIAKYLTTAEGFEELKKAAEKDAKEIFSEAYNLLKNPSFRDLPVYESYGLNSSDSIERHLVLDVIGNLAPFADFYLLTENYSYFDIHDGYGSFSGPDYRIDQHILDIYKKSQWSEYQKLLFFSATRGSWDCATIIFYNTFKRALDTELIKITSGAGPLPALNA